MKKIIVQQVLTGKIKHHGPDFRTAITKSPVAELIVSKSSISGDEVNNVKYHGGDMRVIHHYSEVNYQYLKEKFPEISQRFIPGSFGENLYTKELSEIELCIGDIFSIGTTKVQLTTCRRPCATINLSYQDQRILKEVLTTGRTGWFYRVMEEGVIKAGDVLERIERPYPELPLHRLHVEGYALNGTRDVEFLKDCLATGLMDKGWKPALEKLFPVEGYQ